MPVSELESAEARAAAAGGDEKRAYVQRIFSQIAPRYDLLNHLLSFNIDKAWRRKAIAALGWERAPTGTYVDLCAGTLDVSAQLWRASGFRGQIVGADFAEPMLRAGVGKAPTSIVSPVAADAVDLPLADDSASGAIVAFGIRNVADLDRGLREVHRVLAPGRAVRDPRIQHAALHDRSGDVPSLLSPRAATDWRVDQRASHGVRLPSTLRGQFPDRGIARRAHASAQGFASVQWRTLTFGIAAIHSGTKGHERVAFHPTT